MQRLPALGLLCFASSVVAQDVPNYLGHMEQFEFAAKMIMSTGSCENLGMDVDNDGVFSFAEAAVADAVRDGISVEIAQRMSLQALREEEARLDFLHDRFKSDVVTFDMEDNEFKKYAEFWLNRCAEMSNDARSSSFYRLADKSR